MQIILQIPTLLDFILKENRQGSDSLERRYEMIPRDDHFFTCFFEVSFFSPLYQERWLGKNSIIVYAIFGSIQRL